jgi:hypothetical protein
MIEIRDWVSSQTEWNYDKNGTDWNFPYCNITNTATSPMDITFVDNGTI